MGIESINTMTKPISSAEQMQQFLEQGVGDETLGSRTLGTLTKGKLFEAPSAGFGQKYAAENMPILKNMDFISRGVYNTIAPYGEKAFDIIDTIFRLPGAAAADIAQVAGVKEDDVNEIQALINVGVGLKLPEASPVMTSAAASKAVKDISKAVNVVKAEAKWVPDYIKGEAVPPFLPQPKAKSLSAAAVKSEDDILKAYTDIKYATVADKKAAHEALGITSGNFTSPQLEKIYSFRNPGKKWEPGNPDYDKVNGKIKNFYSEQHGYEKGKTFGKNRVQRLTVNSYLKDVDTLMTEMKKNPDLNYSEAFDKLFGQNYSPKALKNAKFNFWNEKYKNNKKSGFMEKNQKEFMDNLVENMPADEAAYTRKRRPVLWNLMTKQKAWKTFDQGTKDVINNTATEIVSLSGFRGPKRAELRGIVDSQIARFITAASKQKATGKEIEEVMSKMSKKELKEYSNFLIKKKNLSDDINLARSAGIDLDTIHLSHMEAVANNWRMGLAMDNIFLSKANLNQGLQRRMENLLEKTLKDINEVREFPNAKSAKADSIKIKNQLKDIEQQLIDNNLITKVQGKIFGKIDPEDPYKIKPLETEIKETRPLVESRTKDLLDRLGIKDVDKIEYEPVRKEIINKLKKVGLRDGGIVSINQLVRSL